jgi:hypothetical protein
MRPHRVSLGRTAVALLLLLPTAATAQDYKIEALKEAPPSGLSAEVRGALAGEGYKVVDGGGKTYAEFWLRKSVPASEKPGGPKGTIQFPFLAEGALLGAVRFPGEGHDYRDQTIAKGVYTLRYGLQPVNGDHLGVSPFRDYALLLPGSKDNGLADVPKKPLEERSAESAGTSHPAVLMLLTAPASAAATPAMNHDEEKNTWGAVVPLSLGVKGDASPVTLPVQLILVGAAAV